MSFNSNRTLRETQELIARGETSCEEQVEKALSRISGETSLNAFIHVDAEGARQRAREIDARINAGTAGSLAGAVMGIKDLICTKTMPTTCGSKILNGFRPPYNAFVVDRLLDADAIIIGKTNMDEFAMGSTNETSYFGPVLNPANPDHVAGGSSGGSAAAVGAGLVPMALGSDTGGSIRQPGAFCGVVGLKPTYGRVSRYGLVAYASSLDQIGPLTTNVEDAARLLAVIAGKDECDSTSVPYPVPDYGSLLANLKSRDSEGILRSRGGSGNNKPARRIGGRPSRAGYTCRRDVSSPHRIFYRRLLHYRDSRSFLKPFPV